MESNIQNNEKIVCFLDLLGFTDTLRKDEEEANAILEHMYDVVSKTFKCKSLQVSHVNIEMIQSKEKQKKIKQKANLIASKFINFDVFEYVIPISDSIIFVGKIDKITDFVRQICFFMAKIIKQTMNLKFPVKADKNSGHFDFTKRNFPILFRGGFGMGPVNISIKSPIIENGKITNNGINIRERGYVSACKNEGTAEGPRLFCDENFAQKLKESFSEDKDNLFKGENNIIRPVPDAKNQFDNNMYEIIWTYYGIKNGIFPDMGQTVDGKELVSEKENNANDKIGNPIDNKINELNEKYKGFPKDKQRIIDHYKAFRKVLDEGVNVYRESEKE